MVKSDWDVKWYWIGLIWTAVWTDVSLFLVDRNLNVEWPLWFVFTTFAVSFVMYTLVFLVMKKYRVPNDN